MDDHFDVQAPRIGYDDLLKDAKGMSVETIKFRLKKLRNLSDDPEEIVSTAGMQLEVAALEHALESKPTNTTPPNDAIKDLSTQL